MLYMQKVPGSIPGASRQGREKLTFEGHCQTVYIILSEMDQWSNSVQCTFLCIIKSEYKHVKLTSIIPYHPINGSLPGTLHLSLFSVHTKSHGGLILEVKHFKYLFV